MSKEESTVPQQILDRMKRSGTWEQSCQDTFENRLRYPIEIDKKIREGCIGPINLPLRHYPKTDSGSA